LTCGISTRLVAEAAAADHDDDDDDDDDMATISG
jgi:hypothetical protein